MRVRHAARKLKPQVAAYVKRARTRSNPTMGICASDGIDQLTSPKLCWRAPEC